MRYTLNSNKSKNFGQNANGYANSAVNTVN